LPWPPARNAWHRELFSGGSSSGSGVAVAAGFVPAALGTDTGGSVRNPASMCGIIGLKPTYGRVSRRGVIPLSYSLDHVGPMTRTVTDNALVLNLIAGHDPADPASARAPVADFTADLDKGVKGLKIGVRLILDSRVVIGQIWRNRLFLQAFPRGARPRQHLWEKAV
jgi:aspartyl-tRNA(Asn)/glutamyl-tRNA(Gln) amidotransferase subunit A